MDKLSKVTMWNIMSGLANKTQLMEARFNNRRHLFVELKRAIQEYTQVTNSVGEETVKGTEGITELATGDSTVKHFVILSTKVLHKYNLFIIYLFVCCFCCTH